MSHDDPYRPDRGAYTPPTDDELPFDRPRSFDPRRGGPTPVGGGGKSPPLTLLISAGVLVVLIVAVVLFYRSGLRSSEDAPPAVGTPVEQMKVAPPVDAQPVDPAEGLDVYGAPEAPPAAPVFVPAPETPAPRPAPVVEPKLAPKADAPVAPPPLPKKVETPAPVPTPAPAAGGSAVVQIGAFSTPGAADRAYAEAAARHPQFAGRATKRVQEVTTADGNTVYRTSFAGLSREDARAFCGAIRAGGGTCIVP